MASEAKTSNTVEIFSYIARDKKSAVIKGEIKAIEERVVQEQLKKMGLDPISIEIKKESIFEKSDLNITTKKYGFFESIGEGYDEAYWKLNDYISQFGYVFTKEGASQLGGFGTIGNIFPAKWDWKRFWEMTAFLSIILAFMNFLPIPALDGGHIMFVLYEMFSGKKPNDKFLEYAHGAGFILLISLSK